MTTNRLIEAVKRWGRDKSLYDPIMQFAKLNEEVGEIAHELTRNRYESAEIKDAIGDTLVTIIILADILEIDVRDALCLAYQEIKDRHGTTWNGTFIKEQ